MAVGMGLLTIILFVVLAASLFALGGVDPEVGTSSIEYHFEGVSFLTDGQLAGVLGVLEVVQLDRL
jgi:hypothetical protein